MTKDQISIADLILNSKAKRIRRIPHRANWASGLGHPCLRYLVYERTHWEEKKLHGSVLQSIFDLGNDFESIVLRELNEAGLDIIEQQQSFFWKKYEISGHVDGKLVMFDKAIPVEIKSMSPYVFGSIDNIADMKYHKYDHIRGYLAQLNLYMLLDGKDQGIFIFKNKVTGQIKDIWMELDYDLGEELIKKAEIINQHVKDETLPEGADYDQNRCDDCGFVHLCLPEVIGRGVEICTDEELLELLPQYWELKPIAKQFKEIDDQLKKMLEGREKLLVGEYYIDGKWQNRTSYNVPLEIREPYKEIKPYWKKSIIKAQ